MVEYSNESLGTTLRETRAISGLTLNEAAAAAGVSLTHLLDIESGGCGPTKQILAKLMGTYDPIIRAKHSHPAQERRTPQGKPKVEIDWIQLMMRHDEMTNAELLEEVATAVRRLRALGPTATVHMRTPEADLLVSMLDLNEPDLAIDIMKALGLSVTQTRAFLSGAVNRANRRAEGTDSEFVRRLEGLSYPEDLLVL